MTKKGKHKQNKPHGHYCKVCGQHKANEKFSGKGHAAHICKACAAMSPAERSEQMTLNKIEGMAFRYLSEQEIKWLRGKMNDQRPAISAAARDAHGIKFPRYERNMSKKGLTARALEFYIHGEVWDEYGDEIPVHMRFFADNTGLFRRIDYDAPEDGRETELHIGQQPALKFLKAVVQQLNAPFWAGDLSDAGPGDDEDFDPFLDGDEYDFEDDAEDEPAPVPAEQGEPEAGRPPLWSLRLVLNKGGEKEITFYNQMHDEPQELFWLLMGWFEPDGDDFEDNDSDEPDEE